MAIASVVCDRCGAECQEARTIIEAVVGPLRVHHQRSDLCGQCAGDLAAWLIELRKAPATPLEA